MIRSGSWCVFAVVALLVTSGLAQGAPKARQKAPTAAQVLEFVTSQSVGGVRLGMTFDEVSARVKDLKLVRQDPLIDRRYYDGLTGAGDWSWVTFIFYKQKLYYWRTVYEGAKLSALGTDAHRRLLEMVRSKYGPSATPAKKAEQLDNDGKVEEFVYEWSFPTIDREALCLYYREYSDEAGPKGPHVEIVLLMPSAKTATEQDVASRDKRTH